MQQLIEQLQTVAAAGQVAANPVAAGHLRINNQAENNPLVGAMDRVPPNDPIAMQRQIREQDENNDNRRCAVCLNAPATRAYIPCGNFCACLACTERIEDNLCPVCRQNVAGTMNIY